MIIETERLRLRMPSMHDLDALARMYADPEVVRYLGTGSTATRDETAESIRTTMARWYDDGFGMFFVDRKEDGALVGRVGLLVWDADAWKPTTRARAQGRTELEVGYVLAREFWGQGYATEAAKAARDYALRELQAERLIALVRPENTASKAVARKLGMEHERDISLSGGTAELFALTTHSADD